MMENTLNRVVKDLHQAVALQEAAALSDADLLERYLQRRDEPAFAALLGRHGPMVLSLCKRILHNEADAEDAFQATFLVLVRKAGSIQPRGMVGNWLFGVARNTALKAKAMIQKQRTREKAIAAEPKSEVAERMWQQVQEVLDDELSRLPQKYRVPILLCELEGKTIQEAARQLEWPQGTLATRLAEGRRMLAQRLSKHGLLLSSGVLATLVSQGAASSLSQGLMFSTIKAATLLAADQAVTAAIVSAKVIALSEGVVKAMFLTKLKSVLAVVLVAGVIFSGVRASESLFTGSVAATQPISKPSEPQKPEGQQSEKPNPGTTENARKLVSADDKPNPRVPAKIVALQKERLSIIRERAEMTEKAFKAGQVSSSEFIHAKLAVLNAELELCETNKDRLSILEKIVTQTKDMENLVLLAVRSGSAPASSALDAKLARIDAEIALEREKSKPTAPAK